MTPSLRQRILIGSVLWTVGLIVIASAVFSVLIERWPHLRPAIIVHVHGGLQATVTLAAAAACLIAGALLVRRGVQRIDDLRARLASLHQGQGRRLEGSYPSEVQPLVDDLNALLAQRDAAIHRARAKAGDLAHGLKTPLSVLALEADAVAATGQPELAAAIRQQLDRMRRQVEYHLAQARAAASGSAPGVRAPVAESAAGLVRALLRLHAHRGLGIEIDVPEGAAVRVQQEDLDEMLGNLLDNACKWARSRVYVTSAEDGGDLVITVDDDGGGLSESVRQAVLRRGVRADEATPGTGLGLAIVRELAELYGGAVTLDASPAGGCRASLRLPRAAS